MTREGLNDPEAGERQPLLQPPSTVIETSQYAAVHANEQQESKRSNANTILKFALALTGVFLANADTSLMLATYASIASTFHRSAEGSWLLTTYILGYIVALPVYGATSDIYGYKSPLLAAYTLFAAGCIICGTASSLPQLVVGCLFSGFGGAGMTTMVTIVITDAAPLTEVAVLRSYVNVAAILGRSSGAPIGGLLFDIIGWRWSILAQLPVATLCILTAAFQTLPGVTKTPSSRGKKRALDVPGLLTFALTIISFLILLDLGARADRIDDILVLVPAAALLLFGSAFVWIEAYWATHPMIPPSLLKKPTVGFQYLAQMLYMCAQLTIVSYIATYFIRTENASNALAALHVVPAPVGNAIGALVGGRIIRRTKHYKNLSIFASVLSIASLLAISLRWRGHMNIWESLYILPAAMAIGLLNSSQFIALSAAVEKVQLATTISTFSLAQQLGMLVGASGSAALLRMVFRKGLVKRLFDGGKDVGNLKVIKDILSNTRIGPSLPADLQQSILSCYVQGFFTVTILSLSTSIAVFPILAFLPEQRIE